MEDGVIDNIVSAQLCRVCIVIVVHHRASLASLFGRCCLFPFFFFLFLNQSGSAQSLSINKSDNCQRRQLFVTASLS